MRKILTVALIGVLAVFSTSMAYAFPVMKANGENNNADNQVEVRAWTVNEETGETKELNVDITERAQTDGSIEFEVSTDGLNDRKTATGTNGSDVIASGGLDYDHMGTGNNEKIRVNRAWGSWHPTNSGISIFNQFAWVQVGSLHERELINVTGNSFNHNVAFGWQDSLPANQAQLGTRLYTEASYFFPGMSTMSIRLEIIARK